MKRGDCRACKGPLINLSVLKPSNRSASVRLTVQAPGLKRSGEFELCPLCIASSATPERTERLRAALTAELLTLLE